MELLKKIKEISESPNFFVFLEEKLNKKELEMLSVIQKQLNSTKKGQ